LNNFIEIKNDIFSIGDLLKKDLSDKFMPYALLKDVIIDFKPFLLLLPNERVVKVLSIDAGFDNKLALSVKTRNGDTVVDPNLCVFVNRAIEVALNLQVNVQYFKDNLSSLFLQSKDLVTEGVVELLNLLNLESSN